MCYFDDDYDDDDVILIIYRLFLCLMFQIDRSKGIDSFFENKNPFNGKKKFYRTDWYRNKYLTNTEYPRKCLCNLFTLRTALVKFIPNFPTLYTIISITISEKITASEWQKYASQKDNKSHQSHLAQSPEESILKIISLWKKLLWKNSLSYKGWCKF